MTRESLISELVNSLKPVRVFQSKRELIGLFCALVFYSAALLLVGGVKVDLSYLLSTPRFLFETVVLLLASALSFGAAFQMSIPGRESGGVRKAAWGAIALWACALASFVVWDSDFVLDRGWACSLEVVLLTILPLGFVLWRLAKAGNFNLYRRVYWLGTGTLILSIVLMQGFCPVNTPLHLLTWHGLPLFALMVLAVVWMRRKSK